MWFFTFFWAMASLIITTSSAAQTKQAQPKSKNTVLSHEACKAEDTRLRQMAANIKIEIVASMAHPISEPVLIRMTGLKVLGGMRGERTHTPVSREDYLSALRAVVFEGSVEAAKPYRFERSYWPTLKSGKIEDSQEFIMRANKIGPLKLTSATLAKTPTCGERLIGEAVTHVVMIVPDPRELKLVAAGDGACAAEMALTTRLAAQIAVQIEPKKGAKVGETINVSWQRGTERFLANRPAFIVLSMADWVRFEGLHILPIPAGARAPTGIEHGAGEMRVFIPLSTRSVPESGSFKIKAFRTGPLIISHAVVARTHCGETVVPQGGKATIEIEPAQPKVVIQDFFSLERPEFIVVSNDGKYRLETFKASYHVYDISTGIKIIDRAGRHPNFSPKARYVAAYKEGNDGVGGTLEVVDLVTYEAVFQVRGPTVAWAVGDSFVFEGSGVGYPDLSIRRTLVDDPSFNKPDADAKSEENVGVVSVGTGRTVTSAWSEFDLKLLLDQGLIVIEDRGIFELASGESIGDDDVEGSDVASVLATYGVAQYSRPSGWDVGEPLMLSHFSRSVDAALSESNATRQDQVTEKGVLRRQATYYFHHAGKVSTPSTQTARNDKLAGLTALDWRTRTADPQDGIPPLNAHVRFGQQLEQFGICIQPGCQKQTKYHVPHSYVVKSEFQEWVVQYGTQKTTFTTHEEEIEKAIIRDVPVAKSMIKGKPNNVCYTGKGYGDYSEATSRNTQLGDDAFTFRFIPTPEGGFSDVHGAWAWSIGPRKFWLVQTVCSHAGVANAPVVLFVGSPGRVGSIYSLAGAPFHGANLHEDFDHTPNESVLRIRPWIVHDRWLLIAAPAGRSIGVVDLNAPGEAFFLHDMEDVFATAALYRSTDGQHVVQLNTDGQFHVYKTADAERIISGRWLDDEIILVTEEGYFDGTYEAGQFVHLHFPGEAGVHPLAQFERVLRRPDFIKPIMAGSKTSRPAPKLGVPPRVHMEVLSSEGGVQRVKIGAQSTKGLKAVRLFEDGQLIKEAPLSGQEAAAEVQLVSRLSGVWLSGVVEDEAGNLSNPVSIANPRPGGGERRLRAVVVGIDRYSEENLTLTYAASDAKRLATSLAAPRGGYYASVEVVRLVNEEAGPDSILTALEAAIKRSEPGDTVLFSFAGHGVKGPDAGYYLTASGFHSSRPAETGLAWSGLAEVIGKSKVRVVILLDACHSGLSGSQGIASNDDSVAALLKGTTAPILVFAAAKGRQLSYEDGAGATPKWGGGVFTYALVKALSSDWSTSDINHNGAVEISELYRSVKSLVVSETNGLQTPWLVRQDMVGDFALF